MGHDALVLLNVFLNTTIIILIAWFRHKKSVTEAEMETDRRITEELLGKVGGLEQQTAAIQESLTESIRVNGTAQERNNQLKEIVHDLSEIKKRQDEQS